MTPAGALAGIALPIVRADSMSACRSATLVEVVIAPLNAPSSLSQNRTVAKGSGQDWCARYCGLLVVDWTVAEGNQVSGCVPVEKACDYSVAVRRCWGHTGPDRTWTGS
jgi:hypothetical protein